MDDLGQPRPASAGISRRQLGMGGLALAGLAMPKMALSADIVPGALGARRAELQELLGPYADPRKPGLSVAVARGNELVFEWMGGAADLDNNIPIGPSTSFHVASITKQFAAFAIALLERDGRLSVDDDVRKHLPYVPDFGRPMTISQLIHHTSGLRDQWPLLQLAGIDIESLIRQEQVLNLVRRQRELDFEPGSKFSYCNTGYTLLAEIVRAVTGKSFKVFADERIFKPLGMADSFIYEKADIIVPHRCHSYSQRDDKTWKLSLLNYSTYGATSLHTTARDLARWGMELGQPRLTDAAFVQRLVTPGRLNDGTQFHYGFGLQSGERVGRRCLYHGGSDAGFRTNIAHFPEENVTIVVLANSPQPVAYIVEQIGDIILNPPERRIGAGLRGAIAPPPVPLPSLAGAYSSDSGEALFLEVAGDRLMLRTPGGTPQPLSFRANGRFDWGQPELMSYRPLDSKDGAVVRLEEWVNVGGLPTIYERTPLATPGADELDAAVGDYYSQEVDATYSFRRDGPTLVASSALNAEEIVLEPTFKDCFGSKAWFMSNIRLFRGSDGKVTHFTVNSNRMRGVRFRKVSRDA